MMSGERSEVVSERENEEISNAWTQIERRVKQKGADHELGGSRVSKSWL